MISLAPPYQVVNGYTVLTDHEDETLIYVLPAAPTIALKADGTPDFSLLQFLGGGAGAAKIAGGLLTLTTALQVSDETLSRLRRPVMERLRLTAPVRLQPVLFESGTVELIALGAASELNAAEDKPAPESFGAFNVRFLGSGKPSLTGENLAAFQVLLDANAAELIEHALDAPEQPIIVVYRLKFSGLRPSFQIDVRADWHKLYRNLENKAKVNVYFVAAEAESKISKALEETGIEIDTAVFGAGDNARTAAERARKFLTDWILQRMFAPAVDPQTATANAVGQVIDDTIWSLTRSVLPGVGYKLRHLEDEQLRLFSARMNESIAEQLEIVPQGTIGNFFRRLRVDENNRLNENWQNVRAGLIQKVNLNGFPRLEVRVGIENRFAEDELASVAVELARRNPSGTFADNQTFLFRSGADKFDYTVNLLGEDPNFADLYQYRSTIDFAPDGIFGFHPPVTTDWQSGAATDLYVEPRNAYTVRSITVAAAPIFSFAQFPQVTVELRCHAEGETALPTARIVLSAAAPAAKWRFRSFSSEIAKYEYRPVYHREAALGGDIIGVWRDSVDDWLAVADPLPDKLTLNLFVNLPWELISMAFIRLRYDDDANNIHYDEQIDLSVDIRHLRRDYPIADNAARTMKYQLTIFMLDNSLLEGAWRETTENRLLLDRRLVDRKIVRFKTLGGKLTDNRLSEVRVKLQLRAGALVREEHEVRLNTASDVQAIAPWEFFPGDPPAREFFFAAEFVDQTGFVERSDWQAATADLLIINFTNKRISA